MNDDNQEEHKSILEKVGEIPVCPEVFYFVVIWLMIGAIIALFSNALF